MPESISEYLDIDPDIFAQTGAFNAILDVDSRLFIDPHLLKSTAAPELKSSYLKLLNRFGDILKVIAFCKEINDPFWKAADKLLTFPEVKGLCIGYSSKGTSGNGMGTVLRAKILTTVYQIVNSGLKDPEIFELVGLFEDKVGSDRISDMVGGIIADDLELYTSRVFSSLGFETPIINRYNKFPIVLAPKDILRDLPLALDCKAIAKSTELNENIRAEINKAIGSKWKEIFRLSKDQRKELIFEDFEFLKVLIDSYIQTPPLRYDFENDPAGEVIWHSASRKYVKNFPRHLILSEAPTAEEVLEVVISICDNFKDLIENNALHKLLYDVEGKPKKEEAAQLLFYGIADSYCRANNLDLSREANSGRGPVDFKVSSGYAGKVVVEAKLTTNQQLLHGYEVQIEEYKKAEKADESVYLVIDVVNGSETRKRELRNLIHKYHRADIKKPTIVFIDAKPKLSASKYIP